MRLGFTLAFVPGIGLRVNGAAILRRDGFGRLGYSLPADALVRLRVEAAELKGAAERVETDAYELHADGQDFRSPVSFGISEPGAELRGLHESSDLRALANELAGTEMEPSKVGYLYYGAELRPLTPEQLAELAEKTDGAPPGGIAVTLDDAALVGLIGGGLPHQTRPVAPGSEAVVATLCYVGKHH